MKTVHTIFNEQFDVKNPILAVLLLIFCVGFYHSLYTYLLRKYLQHLFFATKHFKSGINRTIMYTTLISGPMLILIFISIFYNNSLLGLETSMTLDEVNVLIVSGYICWQEESRHTPIRGMYLIRDVFFVLLLIGLYVNGFISGTISIFQSIIILAVGIVYYVVLVFFDGIEEFILKAFGLREPKNYNAKFLLTSSHQVADFLQIKDIIGQKKEVIQQELTNYKEILMSLQQNEQDQQILMNFAKLFIPIKKAYEIKEQSDNNQILQEIQNTWEEGSQDSNDEQGVNYQEYHYNTGPTWNDGTSGMGTFKNTLTFTDDFVKQEDQKDYQLNLYEKILRYAFYPVYLATFVEGRLFYLVGYLALFALIGLMFGISNSTVFFSQGINGYSFLSIVMALLLSYPSAKYFLKVSTHNDYDFTNIFLQSMIIKLILSAVFFVIYTAGIFLINNKVLAPQFGTNKGTFTNLIVRIALLTVYLTFMIVNRFATRYTNFKYFIGLSVIMWIGEIIAQQLMNAQI